MGFKEKTQIVTHWPVEGAMFPDVTMLFQDDEAFRAACDECYKHYKDMEIDKVVGIDSMDGAGGFEIIEGFKEVVDVWFASTKKRVNPILSNA